jgi:hypothetical protein
MAEGQVQRFFMADEDNEPLEIVLYSKEPVEVEKADQPPRPSEDDDWEGMGGKDVAIASMQEAHKYIRFYARYVIGAFKGFAGAEVEEMNLKFGLKVGGKTGIPMLAEGKVDADFEVSIKCKFNNSSGQEKESE